MPRCAACNQPLGFGLYKFCTNVCQERFHIENGTDRANEMRARQNSNRFCYDWGLGRPCTDHCARYGFRHACQTCGKDCAKGEGGRGRGCRWHFFSV
jgi:hypothetical protein